MKKWVTKAVVAWSLYDFADTAFSALFITFFYPILIKTYLGGNELHVGVSLGLALLAAALLVPVIGAVADASGRKLPLLLLSTIATVIVTALTGYAGLTAALILGFLANLLNIVDVDLYDAKLVDIAADTDRGKVAGLGVAVGYLGTIASLIMGYVLMNRIGWETKAAVQAMFPATAVFQWLFSLPLFLLLRDRVTTRISWRSGLKRALAAVRYTATHLKDLPGLGPFLLASFIYNNAMHTIIIFLSLYATVVIGLTIQAFFFVFAALAVGSALGSLAAGHLSDRFGPRRLLHAALLVWLMVALYFLNIAAISSRIDTPALTALLVHPLNTWLAVTVGITGFMSPLVVAFIVGGMVGGAALGAVWVGNRHLITRLSPPHKIAEIFGIEGLTEKFSGVIGPITFGAIVFLAGPGNELIGYQRGLAIIATFFIVGLLIMHRVPPPAAKP